ncbi:MAG: THUMP domain-containing protein, partial [Bdellovibrionota bacterium]
MHTTKDSKNSLFFIVVPLGFEDVAQTEIYNHLSVLYPELGPCKQSKGGIELELPLEIGLALNHLLRIPTRILLRLEKFRCRDFPKLYKKTQNYAWAPFLLGKMPKIHVTAKKSRMIHTGRIEESITKGLQDYFKGYPPSKALQAQGDS